MRRTCFCQLALALGSIFFVGTAQSQTWAYISYSDGQSVTSDAKTPLYGGTITLDESGPTPIFRMNAGKQTTCFAGDIEAKVQRTADKTFIVVKRDLKGCGSARFVINNDGSGGRRETLSSGNWTWDGLERGLTLKK
jgi:hypothetical protein